MPHSQTEGLRASRQQGPLPSLVPSDKELIHSSRLWGSEILLGPGQESGLLARTADVAAFNGRGLRQQQCGDGTGVDGATSAGSLYIRVGLACEC